MTSNQTPNPEDPPSKDKSTTPEASDDSSSTKPEDTPPKERLTTPEEVSEPSSSDSSPDSVSTNGVDKISVVWIDLGWKATAEDTTDGEDSGSASSSSEEEGGEAPEELKKEGGEEEMQEAKGKELPESPAGA